MTITIKGKAKTVELEEKLLEMILRSNLKQGDPILSEMKLVDLFGVSRVTVRQTLANLTDREILYKEKGKGTFVGNINSVTSAQAEGLVSKTIAIVFQSIDNSYFSNMARGLEDTMSEAGYQVTFRSSGGTPEKEAEVLQDLIQHRVAGLILSPSESAPLSCDTTHLCREFPNLIIVDNDPANITANAVTSDDTTGGYLATKHLIDLGHERIAHIRGPFNVANAHDRYSGYLKAMIEAFGEAPRDLLGGGRSYDPWEGKEMTESFLNLPASRRPTAIFAASDGMACGAIEVAKGKGLTVPEDLAVVGYGNLMETAAKGFSLTSVQQNGYAIGKTAAEMMLKKLLTPDTVTQKIQITPRLIIKASSGEKQ